MSEMEPLRGRVAQTRAALSRDLAEARRLGVDLLSWREVVRRHPIATAAVAAGAGFLLVRLVTPRRRRHHGRSAGGAAFVLAPGLAGLLLQIGLELLRGRSTHSAIDT